MTRLKRVLAVIAATVATTVATTAMIVASPPARAASAPVKLEVGYIPILAAAPLFVLDGEGWAKQAGIALKLTRFESGPAAIQALAAGQVDVIYAGVAPVLVARSKGVEVSVVASSAVEEMAVVGRGPLARFSAGATPAEAFHRFATETGRRAKIGTQPPGSVPDTVLRHWLNKVAKVNPADVEVVSMGIEKTQQALLAGAIDAATIREPTITLVTTADPSAKVMALGGTMFPDQPGTVMAVRGAVIRDHAEAVAALVKAHVRAVRAIAADPARAGRLSNEIIGKGLVEPEVLEKAIRSPASKYQADPHAIVEPVQRMQAFQAELGNTDGNIPVAEAFDFRFYDAAVAHPSDAP
jgi:NitT/TauT family transport system substrate-binding protein